MSYLITLRLVETIFDPVVDRVKMVLGGATTIKRERVPDEVINELVVFDGTTADDGAGVDDAGGDGVAGVDDAGGDGVAGAGKHEWATSYKRCCDFLCEKFKKNDEDSIMYLQKLSEAVNELINKRGVKRIVSTFMYSKGQAEKRVICKGNEKFEEEDVWKNSKGLNGGRGDGV